MALDGAFLSCLRQELCETLDGAKVDKIHQPSREELLLALRSRSGSYKLFFSVRPNAARVALTAKLPENPAAPPMFCMLLRKRLTGGRLSAIRQNGWERVLYFDFDCYNELGDAVRLTLAAEIMGRYSNLILIDEKGLIVDALKRVDFAMSTVRPLLPGLAYEQPTVRPGSLDLSAVTPERMTEAVCASEEPTLDKALLAVSHGTSPLLCRELAFRVGGGAPLSPQALTAAQTVRLTEELRRIKAAAMEGVGRCPYRVSRPDGSPLEYSFMPIVQYGLDAVGREESSFSAMLESFYEARDSAERIRQKSQDVRRVLQTATERIARRLAHQREEQQSATDREQKRIFGDLLTAELHHIPRGAEYAELVNYYDPECRTVRIPLDPSLSPSRNAQKYYKEYRKAQTAERVLAEQITAGEDELHYLESVSDALSRAASSREVEELRFELADAGYLRLGGGQKRRPAPLGPLTYRSEDGYTILVGRNNQQNDQLTLRMAKGDDLWLHVRNIPGSHVIVLTGGATPPARTVEQAAMLAAVHSSASGSAQVPVEYTLVRYVHKPRGARPGKVIYDHQQTAYVTPSAAETEGWKIE